MDVQPIEGVDIGQGADIPPPSPDGYRERAFNTTVLTLRHESETRPETFQDLLISAINDELLPPGQRLTKDDLSSLKYYESVSLSASELAGHEIVRPVFIISNKAEFDKLNRIFSPKDEASPAAFYLKLPAKDGPVKNIVGSSIRRSGIIISRTQDERILGHEIRHTIDPNNRKGFDAVLSEVFACATDFMGRPDVLKRVIRSYYSFFAEEEAAIDRQKVISGQGKAPRFGANDKSEEWFGELVDRVVDKLNTRIGEIGSVNSQRELLNCLTLEEYLNPPKSENQIE